MELTGPYLHNGGKSTLMQVMELYDDGGNFANDTLSPLIRPLALTPQQLRAVVAFMVALTDSNVLIEGYWVHDLSNRPKEHNDAV